MGKTLLASPAGKMSPKGDISADVAAARQALAAAQRDAPEVTFLDRIRALEQAVDLLLRALEATR